VSLALLVLSYSFEFFTSKKGVTPQAILSLGVAVSGFYLSYMAARALGPDLSFLGQQFGVVDPSIRVTAWPYDGSSNNFFFFK
jgi:hypothetical protein